MPESSNGVKFELLKHQKQTFLGWNLTPLKGLGI